MCLLPMEVRRGTCAILIGGCKLPCECWKLTAGLLSLSLWDRLALRSHAWLAWNSLTEICLPQVLGLKAWCSITPSVHLFFSFAVLRFKVLCIQGICSLLTYIFFFFLISRFDLLYFIYFIFWYDLCSIPGWPQTHSHLAFTSQGLVLQASVAHLAAMPNF